MFLNFESEEKKKKDVGCKFPISLHEVSELNSLPNLTENVTYKNTALKRTQTTIIDFTKKVQKKTGSKLF